MSAQTEAMGDIWKAMQGMADALDTLNRQGDVFDKGIATQTDNMPYGQLYNALVGTLAMTMSLMTTEAQTIVNYALCDDMSMEEAWMFVTGTKPRVGWVG